MLIMGNLINLESVGTGLDDDGMTYPMSAPIKRGAHWHIDYDRDNGIHIDDIELDGDWMASLDVGDKIRIGWVSERLRIHFGIDYAIERFEEEKECV